MNRPLIIRSVAGAVAKRERLKQPVAIHTTLFVDIMSSSHPSLILSAPKSLRMLSSSLHNKEINDPAKQLSTADIHAAQMQLLEEASYLTKTLYRKCLKSIQSLARGNERDETDFSEREQSEQDQLDELFSSSTTTKDGSSNNNNTSSRVSLMAPPVNRQNELSSRANYYHAFAREHFDGHWNLLGRHGFHLGEEGNMRHGLGYVGGGQEGNRYEGGHHHLGGQMAAQFSSNQVAGCDDDDNTKVRQPQQQPQQQQYYMWREEQIEQFTYLIKSGEEKRQWILSDYEFTDPCSKQWPEELRTRIQLFEESAHALVKEMYRRRGWIHSSDYEQYGRDPNEDSDSDDDDDDF
mmetsp:Transcript_11157/g.18400  ORF Transcript_11157/g.18400 Transcript_11157/m.18400 type:complete len:350 (+) Transcript_11157:293-1342(+)